ncbi:hypothetical protein OCU04_011503 [Sclerotinia nivalis]|uniref:MIT domain-containing protein n=1 Tax=Sclerotinia nivalis TaxID=352851 RepID=A0A9X0ACG4_9HELO|nr:hypothetical protein OCU04_011503 [Sclerotinia nivalis]
MPSLSYSTTTEDRLPYSLPTNNTLSNPRSNNSTFNSTLNAPVNRLQRKPSFGNTRQIAPPPQNESQDAIGESRRQPRQPHSRSSSTSGVREPTGNFNRWSQSTASSAGGHIRSRSNSISRLNLGGSGLHGDGVGQSPPRKLQKSRPSIDNSPQWRGPAERSTNPSLPPSLPPIITLPVPQQPRSHSPSQLASALTPSTAGLLSAAVHSTVPDYFEKTWEGSRPRDISQRRSPSRSGNHSISPSPISAFSTETAIRRRPSEEEPSIVKGHSRNRSRAEKSSSSSRSSKQPSQKAMLSKALQKANTAVLLDNAQNYEGAMQAYSEACNLLQQVMARSSGDEDRRKLEAIRNTYTSRINELAKITPELSDEKALPARPVDTDFRSDELPMTDEDDEPATIETATVTRIVNDTSYTNGSRHDRSYSRSRQLPSRGESLLPSALEPPQTQDRNYSDQRSNYFSRYNQSQGRNIETSLAVPMDSQYMPPPLSPRRPLSPMTYGPSGSDHRRQKSSESPSSSSNSNSNLAAPEPSKGHARAPSNESMSWLDTIDESGGSAASSVHSRSSSLNVRRKHIRASSGQTEAEFDAALDAAVEAAYDDGFEPVGYDDDDDDDEIVASVRRRVELAKERVRQSEREAVIEDAHERERKRLFLQMQEPHIGPHDDYEGNESEEEERMLEEMTRGYVMDDFEFGLQSKSALPRESDSSGSFSGRTWHSSNGSIPPLTTVTAPSTTSPVTLSQPQNQPPHPPPSQALPPPPTLDGSPVRKGSPAQSVRSRRLSGQNAKQLKIETSSRLIEVQNAPLTLPPSMPPPHIPSANTGPKTAGLPQQRQGSISMRPPIPRRQGSISGPSSSDFTSPPTAFLTQTLTNDSSDNFNLIPRSGSPNRSHSRAGLRKNFSSSSLKNLRGHTLSVSNMDEFGDTMSSTPLTAQGNNANGRMPAMPTLPTPIAAAFKERMNGAPTGGLYLFNSDLHSPDSLGSPDAMSAGAPIPLEPCPTEYLLRPFWLMRALYQTIAHPRGGYLSTKLFVPRDVWRVKGVKIKGVEDKIANCDFLTAALMKLGQVDTYDADAVLEEMQSLEGILEQVQIALSKKLGSEVGVQGSNGMFKDATMGENMDFANMSSKSGSVSSKASSFSWRRLRSKNSAMSLANNYSNKVTSPDIPKEGLTMGTLPMTSVPRTRFAKRDVGQVQFSGPNANYMSALARLFDAAQAIDQIARQVEDPGLRHADKTQVGLELCTRHAAEFFGFYICRFVLNDISLLLDKFIKRGSEWVLV